MMCIVYFHFICINNCCTSVLATGQFYEEGREFSDSVEDRSSSLSDHSGLRPSPKECRKVCSGECPRMIYQLCKCLFYLLYLHPPAQPPAHHHISYLLYLHPSADLHLSYLLYLHPSADLHLSYLLYLHPPVQHNLN